MMCVTPAVCAAVRVAAFLVLVRRLLSCRKPGKAGLAAALSGAAAISAGVALIELDCGICGAFGCVPHRAGSRLDYGLCQPPAAGRYENEPVCRHFL